MNPPIDILERGAIVEAKDVKYVGNDQRWVNIKYDKEGQTAEGWIYTGQKPTISNVEVLDSSATISMTKPAVLGNPNTTKSAITISLSLFPKAFAESDDSSDEVTPPNPPTIQVLVFQLVHVLVFIISFAIFYRLTKDKWLTTFGSSSVLLIFGFLSQSAFLELFNKIS